VDVLEIDVEFVITPDGALMFKWVDGVSGANSDFLCPLCSVEKHVRGADAAKHRHNIGYALEVMPTAMLYHNVLTCIMCCSS